MSRFRIQQPRRPEHAANLLPRTSDAIAAQTAYLSAFSMAIDAATFAHSLLWILLPLATLPLVPHCAREWRNPDRVVRFAARAAPIRHTVPSRWSGDGTAGHYRSHRGAHPARRPHSVRNPRRSVQLVAASQHLNRKLRDIADEVEQTGALPGKPKQRQLRARPGGLTPVTAGPKGQPGAQTVD
jgi:hypothetical protein